jgi:hypothetical protein
MSTSTVHDDMSMRICSLLPGATEVVAALGLADHLVGISHECDFPPAIKNTPVMIRAVIDQEQMASPDIDQAVTRAATEHESLYTLDDAMFRQASSSRRTCVMSAPSSRPSCTAPSSHCRDRPVSSH